MACYLDFHYRATEDGLPTERARLWAAWQVQQDMAVRDLLKFMAALAARG